MADTMKIKLVKSLAGRQKDQIEVVKSLGPVSYTHLDVYKRQMYNRSS